MAIVPSSIPTASCPGLLAEKSRDVTLLWQWKNRSGHCEGNTFKITVTPKRTKLVNGLDLYSTIKVASHSPHTHTHRWHWVNHGRHWPDHYTSELRQSTGRWWLQGHEGQKMYKYTVRFLRDQQQIRPGFWFQESQSPYPTARISLQRVKSTERYSC